MLFPVFFVLVFLSHLTLLRLPYYWDEAGYYIPAAHDFFLHGALIPISTLSNAHPPLPSILLAAWWHLSGFVPSGTRTFLCIVTAFALLGVFRVARSLAPPAARGQVAFAVTLLTALYPVWFAQSTLAHADMFAAAFTLWGLSYYFQRRRADWTTSEPRLKETSSGRADAARMIFFFSLAALSKETAIVTPVSLAVYEAFLIVLQRRRANLHRDSRAGRQRARLGGQHWLVAALLLPIAPLACWYAYHKRRTGFFFGNPEYLRYNATGNLSAQHVLIGFSHRLMHVFFHMNMFVPVLCMLAAMLLPPLPERQTSRRGEGEAEHSLRPRIALPAQAAIGAVLLANILVFSILGGALLTRYLLPLYPLVLLECVATWRRRVKRWGLLVGFAAVAFVAGIFINPPYHFAAEDNLNYRDMIVLHARAISLIAAQWPDATVLTSWPASDELAKPELGYVRKPIRTVRLENFSLPELEKANQEAGRYDTALIFSTRFGGVPGVAPGNAWARWMRQDLFAPPSRDEDFESSLTAGEAAALLHGSVVWQDHRNGLWAAVLRFPRAVDATLERPRSVRRTISRSGFLWVAAPLPARDCFVLGPDCALQ